MSEKHDPRQFSDVKEAIDYIVDYMNECADRVNDLNQRVVFLETQLTKVVNILDGTNIKPLCERTSDE